MWPLYMLIGTLVRECGAFTPNRLLLNMGGGEVAEKNNHPVKNHPQYEATEHPFLPSRAMRRRGSYGSVACSREHQRMPNYEEHGSNVIVKSASAFFASRVSMHPSEGNDPLH